MIKHGSQLGYQSPTSRAIQITDFNNQRHRALNDDLENTTSPTAANSASVRSQVYQHIMADRRTSHLSHENNPSSHNKTSSTNNEAEIDKAAVTVRNENLFNMMKINVERERQQNLQKM